MGDVIHGPWPQRELTSSAPSLPPDQGLPEQQSLDLDDDWGQALVDNLNRNILADVETS